MSECKPDWSILDEITTDKTNGQDVTVDQIIDRIARRLARDKWFGKVIEREDAFQVARTATAMDATGARKALADGKFGWWLRCEVMKSDPACGHVDGGPTYETLVQGFPPQPVGPGRRNPKRSRPASLDGLAENHDERDIGLPSGVIVQGGEVWATHFDVREAWASTQLTEKQRRVLFMRCFVDETEDAIGRLESISKQAVCKHIKLGANHLRKSPHLSWLTN